MASGASMPMFSRFENDLESIYEKYKDTSDLEEEVLLSEFLEEAHDHSSEEDLGGNESDWESDSSAPGIVEKSANGDSLSTRKWQKDLSSDYDKPVRSPAQTRHAHGFLSKTSNTRNLAKFIMNTRNNIAAALIEESKDKACDGMIPSPDDELESRQCNENNKSASSKWRLDNIVPSPKLSKASDVIGEVQWVNEVTMQSQNKTPLRNKKAVLCEGKQSTTRIKSPVASVLLASTPNSGLPEATSTEHRFEQQEQTTAKWHSRRKKLHTNKKNRCYLDKSRQGPKETTFNRQRTPTTRGKSADSSDNDKNEPISPQCSIRKRLSSPKNAPEPLEDVQYPGSDSICDSNFLSLPAPPCTPILPAARSRKRYYRGTVKTPRSKRRKVLRPPLQSSNDGVVATDSLSSSLCTPSKPCGKAFCFHCM